MKKNIVFLLLFFLSYTSKSEARSWVINPDHSEVMFQIGYLHFGEVTGRIKKFEGEIFFDGENIPKKITVTLFANFLDTANSIRDGHLRSSSFLNTKLFPIISFQSDQITKSATGFNARGLLKIKDQIKPLTLTFTLSNTIQDTWKFENRFAKFRASFKRSDFNLKWNKTLMDQKFLLEDGIDVFGQIQLQPSGKKTPSSNHKIPDTNYIREREKFNRGEQKIIKNFAPAQLAKKMGNVSQKSTAQTPSLENHVIPKKEKTFWWWGSLFYLGLIGFIAAIIVSYSAKNLLSDYFGPGYNENGKKGFITDVVAIIILVTYSICFWIIGWT